MANFRFQSKMSVSSVYIFFCCFAFGVEQNGGVEFFFIDANECANELVINNVCNLYCHT